MLFLFQCLKWEKFDFRPFFFFKIGFFNYKFSSKCCFGCIPYILACCILYLCHFNVFFSWLLKISYLTYRLCRRLMLNFYIFVNFSYFCYWVLIYVIFLKRILCLIQSFNIFEVWLPIIQSILNKVPWVFHRCWSGLAGLHCAQAFYVLSVSYTTLKVDIEACKYFSIVFYFPLFL